MRKIGFKTLFIDKETLEKVMKERPAGVGGPTEEGWYLAILDPEPTAIYPRVFKTEQEAYDAIEQVIREYIEDISDEEIAKGIVH